MEDLSSDTELSAAYLSGDEIKLACSLLYQAYHDDPFFMSCFDATAADYEQKLRAAIREELMIFWEQQQPIIGVYQAETLVAVACITLPDNKLEPQRFWHWRLKMMLTAGYVSTKQMIEKEQKVKDALQYNAYHLLSFIAVHPNYQHHGIGHYILAAIDSLVAENSQSSGLAVLVTLDKYTRFFESFAFNLVDKIQVGKIEANLMFKAKKETSS